MTLSSASNLSHQPSSPSMTKLSKALLAAGLSAALVGCGGGGSETTRIDDGGQRTPPGGTAKTLTLASVRGVTPSTQALTIPAGETVELTGGYHSLTCPHNGPDCEVTVSGDTVTYTGGDLIASVTPKGQMANNAQTPNQTDDQAVKAAYETAKGLVDNLNNQSDARAVNGASEAVSTFQQVLQSASNLTAEQRKKYEGYIVSLQGGISQVQGRIASASTWETALNAYTLSNNMLGLPDRTLAGVPNPAGNPPIDSTLTSTRNAKESLGNWVFTAARESD